MSKFNIGDRVISKGYPYLGDEVGVVVGIDIGAEADDGKYFVKFNSLDMHTGWAYGIFRNYPNYLGEPYEGYAEWVDEDDLVKVEEECEKVIKSEFNIGDRVVVKDYPSIVKEVGVIVGIDPRKDIPGKYLVKFDSLDAHERYAIWLDNIIKVEEECEEECKEEENEEDTKIKFNRIREQKEEIVKNMNEKVLKLTLKIKEIEREIEKIKKEWYLE